MSDYCEHKEIKELREALKDALISVYTDKTQYIPDGLLIYCKECKYWINENGWKYRRY